MRDYYTSKDICVAFGIPTRKFQYLLDKGWVIPDVRDRQPREYSAKEAVIIGVGWGISSLLFHIEKSLALSRTYIGTIKKIGGPACGLEPINFYSKNGELFAFWNAYGNKHEINLSDIGRVDAICGADATDLPGVFTGSLVISVMLNDAYSRVA